MDKTKRLLTIAFLMLPLLILRTGCVQSYQDLFPLREKIIQEYKESNVSVVIQNGNTVGVSFINTAFNGLEQTKKEAKAKEIAIFVKENYKSIDNIDMIWVSFTIYKTYFFVFNYTNSLDTFFYKVE